MLKSAGARGKRQSIGALDPMKLWREQQQVNLTMDPKKHFREP